MNTIESVLKQNYPNWEHIIVDDISTDNTWEVINEYCKQDKRIKGVKRNRDPKGAQTCRNLGLLNSKGNYIIFLDSDDLILPFCLSQRLAYIKAYPDKDLLVFPKKPIPGYTRNILLRQFLSYHLPCQIMDSTWNRKYLNKLGGFNLKLKRFQDAELHIRALLDEELNFKFFADHKIDNIYNINITKSEGGNVIVVYGSYRIFIREVSKLLVDKGKDKLLIHIRFYLRSWLIHYHTKSVSSFTRKLVSDFREIGIISFFLNVLILINIKVLNVLSLKGKWLSKTIYYTAFIIK